MEKNMLNLYIIIQIFYVKQGYHKKVNIYIFFLINLHYLYIECDSQKLFLAQTLI